MFNGAGSPDEEIKQHYLNVINFLRVCVGEITYTNLEVETDKNEILNDLNNLGFQKAKQELQRITQEKDLSPVQKSLLQYCFSIAALGYLQTARDTFMRLKSQVAYQQYHSDECDIIDPIGFSDEEQTLLPTASEILRILLEAKKLLLTVQPSPPEESVSALGLLNEVIREEAHDAESLIYLVEELAILYSHIRFYDFHKSNSGLGDLDPKQLMFLDYGVIIDANSDIAVLTCRPFNDSDPDKNEQLEHGLRESGSHHPSAGNNDLKDPDPDPDPYHASLIETRGFNGVLGPNLRAVSRGN